MPRAGATPWSRLWLSAYNTAAACDRLESGRALADAEGAVSLEVVPGRIRAAIQTSGGPHPLRAAVRCRPGEADTLAVALEDAGLAPTDIPDPLVRASLTDLVADTLASGRMEMGCACASWIRPCAHLAALALAFAAEIDRDPLRLLDFAFRDFRALLARPAAETPGGASCGSFWLGETQPPAARAATQPVNLPMRVRTPPPVKGRVSDIDLSAVMREVCAAMAQVADTDDIEAAIAAVPFGLPGKHG